MQARAGMISVVHVIWGSVQITIRDFHLVLNKRVDFTQSLVIRAKYLHLTTPLLSGVVDKPRAAQHRGVQGADPLAVAPPQLGRRGRHRRQRLRQTPHVQRPGRRRQLGLVRSGRLRLGRLGRQPGSRGRGGSHVAPPRWARRLGRGRRCRRGERGRRGRARGARRRGPQRWPRLAPLLRRRS